MDLFKTKITAVDDSKVTTIEKKRMTHWAKGLKGAYGPNFNKFIRKARTGQKISPETRAKISATLKAKFPVKEKGAIRLTEASREALSKKMREKSGRPVMTYYGVFPSVRAVSEASGYTSYTVRAWMQKYPEHYYYIN
jgi:hypothetical protein